MTNVGVCRLLIGAVCVVLSASIGEGADNGDQDGVERPSAGVYTPDP